METIEPIIQNGVQWLRLAVETVGALIIAAGVLVAAATFLRAGLARLRTSCKATTSGCADAMTRAIRATARARWRTFVANLDVPQHLLDPEANQR